MYIELPPSSFASDSFFPANSKQPLKKEITSYIKILKKTFGNAVEIFPLHSELPESEKNKLLTKDTRIPRIIVATDIAEESITIPYMYLVIDLGTKKVLRYDEFGTPVLGLEDTSYASALQRK